MSTPSPDALPSASSPASPAGPSGSVPPAGKKGILDWIEWVGNKLPEPALIFVILAAVVIVVSAIGTAAKWEIQPRRPQPVMVEKVDASGAAVLDAAGKPVMTPKKNEDGKIVTELVNSGAPIQPRSLLTSEGVYWMFSSMLRNFTTTPALGLIFVAMLGIGLAEKFGLFGVMMRALAFITPKKLLTPMLVLMGGNSSVASDAGYVILPPLAAALFLAVGRHPIAGLAAAFAGVAGGFGGGFFPTGGDGALTGFAQDAARVIDPNYTLTILHNQYFKAISAVVVMLGGWLVTDLIVEPRLMKLRNPSSDPDIPKASTMALTGLEKKGLTAALAAMVVVLGTFTVLIFIPGAPLHGQGVPRLNNDFVPTSQPIRAVSPTALGDTPATQVLYRPEPAEAGPPPTYPTGAEAVVIAGKPRMSESPGDRWSHVILPIIFLTVLIPGMVYGMVTGTLRSQKDFVEGLYHGIRTLVPVLCIAFFMSQFVNYFAYTRLDRMLAYAGGGLLVEADLPVPVLLALFVLIVVLGDFALSGMLSKFGVMAPIFIPMFMFVGISPELTTAAYRIGDSVVNIITPLNSYLLIILVVLQKYQKNAGLGSLISLMLPYSVLLFVMWTGFLLIWYAMGWDLGPDAPLHFNPAV
ncbi:MAG: AbgT family transporter [bacterium]